MGANIFYPTIYFHGSTSFQPDSLTSVPSIFSIISFHPANLTPKLFLKTPKSNPNTNLIKYQTKYLSKPYASLSLNVIALMYMKNRNRDRWNLPSQMIGDETNSSEKQDSFELRSMLPFNLFRIKITSNGLTVYLASKLLMIRSWARNGFPPGKSDFLNCDNQYWQLQASVSL